MFRFINLLNIAQLNDSVYCSKEVELWRLIIFIELQKKKKIKKKTTKLKVIIFHIPNIKTTNITTILQAMKSFLFHL